MRGQRDAGQAAVEFAVALPIVIVLVLGLVQVLVVGSRQVAIEQLARNGARAASVAADPVGAGRNAVEESSRLDQLAVDVTTTDTRVIVTVRYTDPTSVPVVGRLIGDAVLTATATMAREPP